MRSCGRAVVRPCVRQSRTPNFVSGRYGCSGQFSEGGRSNLALKSGAQIWRSNLALKLNNFKSGAQIWLVAAGRCDRPWRAGRQRPRSLWPVRTVPRRDLFPDSSLYLLYDPARLVHDGLPVVDQDLVAEQAQLVAPLVVVALLLGAQW